MLAFNDCTREEKLFLILISTALFIGPAPWAGEPVVLTFPLDIELDELDDAPFRRGMFSRKRKVELEPGTHKLVAHYYHIEDLDGNEHQTYRSPRVTLSFVARAGMTYRIGYAPPAQDKLETGGRGAVSMWIETESGERVKEPVAEPVTTRAVDVAPVVAPEPTAQEQRPATANLERKPAGVPEAMVHRPVAKPSVPGVAPADAAKPVVVKDQKLADEMLRFWWDKASPAQRQAFKKWVQSQP